MYLSRIELDLTRRDTMRALSNPNLLHGAVERAFPGERERRLWRLDTLRGRQYLLLLSPQKPDLRRMAAQFGTGEAGQTKSYASLLDRITEGSTWRFRLTANPTKSCKTAKADRGEVHAHVSVKYQEEWLLERAEKHGFSLEPDGFAVTSSKWYSFCKGAERKRVSLLGVTYEGVLRVTDAERFCQALIEGIGRGKAYGMGLLTVVRAEGGA